MGRIKYYSKLRSRDKDVLIQDTLQPLMETCTRKVERDTLASSRWYCRSCGVSGFGDDTYHQRKAPDEQYNYIDTWALMLLNYMPEVKILHNRTLDLPYTVCVWNINTSRHEHETESKTLADALSTLFLKWQGVIDERGKIVERVEGEQ